MDEPSTGPLASEDHNPYRAPTTSPESTLTVDTHAELIRKQHVNHESSVKAIGGLYLLGAIVWIVILARSVFSWRARVPLTPNTGMSVALGLGIMALGLSIALAVAGVGLRWLTPWGKWMSTGLCVLTIGFAVVGGNFTGLLLSSYVLYLLYSKKGRMVFSPEYQQVIRETPHVRSRTAIVTWVVLAIFLLMLFVGIGYTIIRN